MIDAEAGDAFRNRVAGSARGLASVVGYFVTRIAFDALGEDSLEITLRDGPSKPDVMISLSNIHHLSISKPPEISGCFVDEISLIHLPRTPLPWPEEAVRRVRRFDGLCELAWLRIAGPAEVDAVASIVTVYTALSDDEASRSSYG